MTKPKVRYVDYNPDAYITGVGGKVPGDAQAVYWMVCSLIMSKRGPIQADVEHIARLVCYRPSKVRRLLDALIKLEKLTEIDGYLHNDRAQSEVERARKRIETAQENGRNGGRPPNDPNQIGKPAGSSGGNLSPATNQHGQAPKDNSENPALGAAPAQEGGETKAWTPVEIEAAKTFIVAFDDARASVWGQENRRPWAGPKDLADAVSWVRQGATLPLVRETLLAVHRKLHGQGSEMPKVLKFHNNDIADAIRRGGAPMPSAGVAAIPAADRQARIAEKAAQARRSL